ncbi:hypothetical protein [Pseudonocardia humida]|uniref:Acyl-CoA carboxylase epsilon subunit-like protein n=1 Tax=Pseudonocardia humida TaxID=2800819 RepID=A0ABT1A3P0_9PSEU|nr:hypothetical protein [Pseudonocardia humida]MCO1657624.1 hypothetical protein [Pseudonocardia humida]
MAGFVLRALTEQRWRGAHDLAAPQQVRSREFAETLARVVGAAPPRQRLPFPRPGDPHPNWSEVARPKWTFRGGRFRATIGP